MEIVDVIGERVTLKKVGRQYAGLCPFHTEKSASFYVHPEKAVYHCHGCQAGGTVFTFLQRIDGLSFQEAVEVCARKAGVTLRYEGEARSTDSGGKRRRMMAAAEAAAAFYHDLLLTSPEASAARRYWKERGFNGDDARAFQVGFAPDAWDRLVRHLGAAGFAPDLLIEAGLASRSSLNRAIDFFRNRLVFPIHSAAGDVLGFGGRVLPGGDGPKYRNSPENDLYAKSRVLYNLQRAKDDMVKAHEVVVVEGYTDVIALAKAGVRHAVATCGTALGEPHLEILRRYGTSTHPLRVVLAFDADAAGRAAGERGFEMYGKFNLDVRAASLPEGTDPADFALADPEGARRAVAEAAPLMEFKLKSVLAQHQGGDPESRARAMAAAATALAEHPNDIARDMWSLWLAEELRVDKGKVDGLVHRSRGRRSSEPPPARRRAPTSGRAAKEAELVRVAIHGPQVEAERARRWPRPDIADAVVADALSALDAADGSVDVALETLDGEPAALLASCAVEDPDVDDLTSWAREVFSLIEVDKIERERAGVRIDDLEGYRKQLALTRRRLGLQGRDEPDER